MMDLLHLVVSFFFLNFFPRFLYFSTKFLVWHAVRFMPSGFLTLFIFTDAAVHILSNFFYLFTSYKPNTKSTILLGLLVLRITVLAFNAFEMLFFNFCGFPFACVLWVGAHVVILLVMFTRKCRKPAKKKVIKVKSSTKL